MQFIYTHNLDLLVIFGSVAIMMLMTYLLTKSILENKSKGLRKYNLKVNEYINSIINHSSEFKDLVNVDINAAAIAENSFEDEVYMLRDQIQNKEEKLAYFEKSVAATQVENEELQEKVKELEITDKDLIQVEELTIKNKNLKLELEELKLAQEGMNLEYENEISNFKDENINLNKKILEIEKSLESREKEFSEIVENNSLRPESEKLVSILNLIDSKELESSLMSNTQEEPSEIGGSKDSKIVKLEKVTENMDKDEIIDVFKKLLAS